MSSTEIVPVRAWPKWMDREGFAWVVQDWPVSQIGEWKCMTIPIGATGGVLELWSIDSLVGIIDRSEEFGPLRSLRVLLSWGYEVELTRMDHSVAVAQGSKAVMLEPGCMKFSLFASDGKWLHGGWYMPEVTDGDAVSRAITEAIAWLGGQGAA